MFKTDPLSVIKIISGGQTGADIGALRGAVDAGIPTGGNAPKGWLTEKGPQQRLLESFGLVECELGGGSDADAYRQRTTENVLEADVTIIIGRDSPGSHLTKEAAIRAGRPWTWLPFNPTWNKEFRDREARLHANTLASCIAKWGGSVINVAGNRESKSPGVEKFAREVIRLTISDIQRRVEQGTWRSFVEQGERERHTTTASQGTQRPEIPEGTTMKDIEIKASVTPTDIPVDIAEVAEVMWGKKIQVHDEEVAGCQEVWSEEDDDGNVIDGLFVTGDKLTDEQLDFLDECDAGDRKCYTVAMLAVHSVIGDTLSAIEYIEYWCSKEPVPNEVKIRSKIQKEIDAAWAWYNARKITDGDVIFLKQSREG